MRVLTRSFLNFNNIVFQILPRVLCGNGPDNHPRTQQPKGLPHLFREGGVPPIQLGGLFDSSSL